MNKYKKTAHHRALTVEWGKQWIQYSLHLYLQYLAAVWKHQYIHVLLSCLRLCDEYLPLQAYSIRKSDEDCVSILYLMSLSLNSYRSRIDDNWRKSIIFCLCVCTQRLCCIHKVNIKGWKQIMFIKSLLLLNTTVDDGNVLSQKTFNSYEMIHNWITNELFIISSP